MPGASEGTVSQIYIVEGFPDALGGHPYVSAPINSVNLYCYPTIGINVGALVTGQGIPENTRILHVYPTYFVLQAATIGAVNGVVTGSETPVILYPPLDQNDPNLTCAGVPDLYERQFNFTNFGTNTPNAQQPGNKLDLEFNTIGDILNHIRCRLSQLQRDDGFLRTEMIGLNGILAQISKATENAMISLANTAANYDQYYAASEQSISNKLSQAEAAAISANNSANSAQMMSSQASVSAMGALTSKNQTIVALAECQAILAQLLAPSGPVSLTQANATQAQQSAQSAIQSEVATSDLRDEVEAWHSAIEGFLVQATNAKNNSVSASLAAVAAASGATASAGQASDSAAAAAVSAGQAAGSAAAALAHSLNYIPGPQGPAGTDGAPGNTPFVLHGEYNNGVTYMAGDAVTFQGSLYRLNGFIGAAGYNPAAYPGYWFQLAAGGAKGDKGDQGNPGAQGANGAPGVSDRYKTTSTSTLTLDNNDGKSIVIETGLSWTPGQSAIISYDAGNHMHGTVVSYAPSTGVMVFNSDAHTGTGTYSTWIVNLAGAVTVAAGIPEAPNDEWSYVRFQGQWRRHQYIPAAGTILSEWDGSEGMYDASGTYYDVPTHYIQRADGIGGSSTQNVYSYPNGYKTSWNTGQSGEIWWMEGTYSGTFNWGVKTNFEEYQNGLVVSGYSVEQDYYSAGHQFASVDMNGYSRVFIYDGSGNWHTDDVYPSDAYGTKYGTPVYVHPDTGETGGWQIVADGMGGSIWIPWDGQAPYPPDGTDWGSYSNTGVLSWYVYDGYGSQVANGDFTWTNYGETITWQGNGTMNTMFGWSANYGDYISSGNFYDPADGMYKNYNVTYTSNGEYQVNFSY